MKKQTILSFVATAAIAIGGCTSAHNVQVPADVQTRFASQYPGVTVKHWAKEGNNYEAKYMDGSVRKTVVLDPSGQVVQTETRIETSALPASVMTYINANYGGAKVHASSITSASGVQTYEVNVKDTDLIFDKDGNFLSKEEDND